MPPRGRPPPRTLALSAPFPDEADGGAALDLEGAFRRFAPALGRKALRILGRRDEADDLVQDVFLDAQRSLHRIREPRALYAWLCVATVRLARYRLRLRRLRRFLRLDDLADYSALADRSAHPAQRLLVTNVYRALDALPVEERIAWTLRCVDGEELDRVALLCGCSLATVKRRVRAAQRALEEVVKP